MADGTTPRLNLVKPEVGGSADTWGDKWNENADKIDAAIIKPDEENVWSAPQHFDGGLYDGGERVVRQSDLGTAATRDVTTSPTDTTEGRVLKVGDFGVGEPIILTSSDDLDDIMSPGIYMHMQASAPANTPIPDAGIVTVFKGTGSYVVQVWCSRSWIIRKFQRVLHPNDGWSSWVEFYHTGNDSNLVKTSRTISTGTGLTGGGNLSANRTISLASSHWPIGVGQTWQDVTSQRAAGVTYTNTTGRPIAVSVYKTLNTNGTSVLQMFVGGVMVANDQANHPGSGNSQVFGVVPPGETYSVKSLSSGSISTWLELR